MSQTFNHLFIFELIHVRNLLASLRICRDMATTEKEKESLNTTICILKSQLTGKLRNIEPFMRFSSWLKDEIRYERDPDAKEFHNCECKKLCRGKMCADCWTEILKEVHGQEGHTCFK